MSVDDITKLLSILVPIVFGGGGIYLWRRDKAEAVKVLADAEKARAEALKVKSDRDVGEFNAVVLARKDFDTQMMDRFNTLNTRIAALENEVQTWKTKTYKLVEAIQRHLALNVNCENNGDLVKSVTDAIGE